MENMVKYQVSGLGENLSLGIAHTFLEKSMKAKRLLSLLFVVSIAYVGCADKKPSTVTHLERRVGWSGTMEEFSKLKEENTKLKKQLAEVGIKTEPDGVLMNQTAVLEVAIGPQNAEITELEIAIGSQKAEIDRLKKAYRQYAVVIESQRETIDSLQNLCHMYEDATKSLVKTIENTKNILEITSRTESNSKEVIGR